jgi:hypothetical protein
MRIFISSLARGDMGAIRQAARAAVESLDMHPVMFESGAAAEESSRRALLDRVASCDALVLLLGAEYGEPGTRGMSPTEEEFDEARERAIPVLALVQKVDREPAQEDFMRRVRGKWDTGRLTADFTGANDVGLAVVKALDEWRRQRSGSEAGPAAQERALQLARGDEQRGSYYGGSKLRVVAVPALDRPLIDAVALGDGSLVEDLSGAARTARLVPQSMGIEPNVGRDSIVLQLSGGRGFEPLALTVGFDGSIVAEGPVGGDELGFGGSVVMSDRARVIMDRAAAFAEAVWQRIDIRDEVRQVFLACAVPEAEHKVYALEPVGSSMSMPMSMPHILVAPDPPLDVRRADLCKPETLDRLQAVLRRGFEVEGAVHPRPDERHGSFWS